MVTSTRSVRLAAMDNEDNINRDAAVAVGPNLGSGGDLVGENGQSQDEGSVESVAGASHPRGN